MPGILTKPCDIVTKAAYLGQHFSSFYPTFFRYGLLGISISFLMLALHRINNNTNKQVQNRERGNQYEGNKKSPGQGIDFHYRTRQ